MINFLHFNRLEGLENSLPQVTVVLLKLDTYINELNLSFFAGTGALNIIINNHAKKCKCFH
jgi:hypothetical protein